jgi:hypothetical protein
VSSGELTRSRTRLDDTQRRFEVSDRLVPFALGRERLSHTFMGFGKFGINLESPAQLADGLFDAFLTGQHQPELVVGPAFKTVLFINEAS